MATATMRRLVARLLETVRATGTRDAPALDLLRADPKRMMAGVCPDAWQTTLLRSSAHRLLMCCCRQSGKSTVAAALALKAALLEPRSLVLLLAPSERQSGELARKVFEYYDRLGRPVGFTERSALQLHLGNGSRVVALPGTEKTIRGYSGARLLVIDEAARVPDDLYRAVRPMLAVSKGRLVVLSSPFGKRGFFHDEWTGGSPWQRVKITAHQCPRIAPEFLEEERLALGERWYRQEYLCSFEDVVDSVFAQGDIDAACDDGVRPLFLGGNR